MSSIEDYLKDSSHMPDKFQQDCYSSCALYVGRYDGAETKDTCELINAVVALLKSEDNADLIGSRLLGRTAYRLVEIPRSQGRNVKRSSGSKLD